MQFNSGYMNRWVCASLLKYYHFYTKLFQQCFNFKSSFISMGEIFLDVLKIAAPLLRIHGLATISLNSCTWFCFVKCDLFIQRLFIFTHCIFHLFYCLILCVLLSILYSKWSVNYVHRAYSSMSSQINILYWYW